MASQNLIKEVREKAEKWLSPDFDEDTRNQVKYLLESNESELVEAFWRDLEFGTGGLRGIMGVGTNRMNIYVLGMATQGLSNYLKKEFAGLKNIGVVVAHDSRNNSRLFAERTADIFTSNNFKVYLFDDLRPTPELSFTIRHFKCQAGVVITASHNPKEYNGYKVYWEDGGQIISPHDKNIINEVQKIKNIEEVRTGLNKDNVQLIGKEIDEVYIGKIKELSLSPEIIHKQRNLKIVYTPIHGSGVVLVPMALKSIGFDNIYNVPEQDITDGNFPTVHSPNPEEPAALNMAIEKAREVDADLVMGTDPDADRVGIAIKDNTGKFILLNGNQTASILINYLLTKWAEKGKLKGKEYIVKTIVTTELLTDIAEKYGVEHYDVLTGFKYIADVIEKFEGKKIFIGGGEESYGYLAGEFVRDKDAIISCTLVAEIAAWAKDNGKSLFELLTGIYTEFGMYKESIMSVVRKGKDGAEEIQRMMEQYRKDPPSAINDSEVVQIMDYLDDESLCRINAKNKGINIPRANVIQFFTKDGSKISVRPSGTEPKIKYYFSVRDRLSDPG
ncbi:MAG: phospho-sugar mutase, partial [Bacteroidales bacterium]